MKVIIGLGNYAEEYKFTRHNIGFMCVDRFAWLHKLKFRKAPKFEYAINKGLCLIKPKTFMNKTGLVIPEIEKMWQVEDILIIHDDIEIPKTQIRIRSGGGDGGHNGVKSILEKVGIGNLKRIRVGIGKKKNVKYKDYVLEQMTADELLEFAPVFDVVAEFIDVYATQGYNKLLDYFSQWKRTYSKVQTFGIDSPEEENCD